MLKKNDNFSLTIPLRDNDTQAFEKMAKDLGVWNRVSLLDIHNNTELLIELFDKSDFVAFVPQKRITKDVPNSLIDRLVRGKPVVVSDVIDFSDTVEKRKIGYVIPKGERARKMEISTHEYEEMSKKAYEYSKLHSQESYASIIEEAYYSKVKPENSYRNRIKIRIERTQSEKSIRDKGADENENSNYKSLGDIR